MFASRHRPALLRALHPGPLNSELSLPADGLTIGRDARTADLIVRRPDVSRQHARLSLTPGGGWKISDLASTNGLQINGQRVEAMAELTDGDVISLGRARSPDFEFVAGSDQRGPRQLTLTGPGPWPIGRDLDHAISLPADPIVSLQHARILANEDGLWIQDLDSRNGTWLNGRRVRRGQIDPASEIIIGSNLLKIQSSNSGTQIEIHSLQQALGVRAEGLGLSRSEAGGLSFDIVPGRLQLVCLRGADQRRSLIQLLCGLDQPRRGKLAFSESAIDTQLERRRDRIGEVHPDCQPGPRQRLGHFLEDLACLALAGDLSSAHRRELITTTLEALGLSDLIERRWQTLSALHQRMGLIAAALLNRPGLLVIEHKADQLSGPDQLRLLEKLRGLASSSLTIVLVCDRPLDAAEDTELVNIQETKSAGLAARALRPQPHRASLARQRVLFRRSLLAWLSRPLALIEALLLPILLASALWLALPERPLETLGLIATLVSVSLASAFQVSRWQAGLVYLSRRHLLLGDALIALSVSAMLVGLLQVSLASLSILLLGEISLSQGWPLIASAAAMVPAAVAVGLAFGLAAGARPWLALLLVAVVVASQVFAAALLQAEGETAGLILQRLAELSPLHWGQALLTAIDQHSGWPRPLILLLALTLAFLALARLFLRRRLH